MAGESGDHGTHGSSATAGEDSPFSTLSYWHIALTLTVDRSYSYSMFTLTLRISY